ncbi:kinase-like domain-containing protein [Mucidula mucida]|nr:kinase-like domain-containing protein [Mucidula mucida]
MYQEQRANEAKEYLNNEEATSAESEAMPWQGRTEESFTDEEIIQLVMCNTTPDGLAKADHPYLGRRTLIRFAEDAVVKPVYTRTEALVLAMVAEHTSIPVPKVRRVLKVERRGLYLVVMDFIRGKQLAAIWGDMSDEDKEHVARTLQGYVQQLRKVDIPRRRTLVFNDDDGTLGKFSTQQELVDRMNELTVLNGSVELIGRFDASKPLVLTHNDLNARNVMVDKDKRLWLIDWSESGFFPEFWERLSMQMQQANEERVQEKKLGDWRKLMTIMCGESSAEASQFLAWCTAVYHRRPRKPPVTIVLPDGDYLMSLDEVA